MDERRRRRHLAPLQPRVCRIACSHIASVDVCPDFTSYAVDPFNPSRRWVVVNDFYPAPSRVFLSENAGASWRGVAAPAQAPSLAAADPRVRNRLLAGTDGRALGEHGLRGATGIAGRPPGRRGGPSAHPRRDPRPGTPRRGPTGSSAAATTEPTGLSSPARRTTTARRSRSIRANPRRSSPRSRGRVYGGGRLRPSVHPRSPGKILSCPPVEIILRTTSAGRRAIIRHSPTILLICPPTELFCPQPEVNCRQA